VYFRRKDGALKKGDAGKIKRINKVRTATMSAKKCCGASCRGLKPLHEPCLIEKGMIETSVKRKIFSSRSSRQDSLQYPPTGAAVLQG